MPATLRPQRHGETDELACVAIRMSALCRVSDLSIPFAIRAISDLGIADYLAEGPSTAEELAKRAGLDAVSLRRVMLALAIAGCFEVLESERFSLCPPGDLLRSDHPFSLRDAYRSSRLEAGAWAELLHSVRTGEAAFDRAYGVSHRQYRADEHEEDARMDRVHRAATRIDLVSIVRAYDWTKVASIVDVGGGTGMFLAGLLSRFRKMRGILFDLPRMVSESPELIAAAGVEDRCEIVGGDFFDSVPAGADVYVLKAVVGGWDDTSVHAILSNVREAMRDDSRLLVIEPILQYEDGFSLGNAVQLQSLVLYGGLDRTREDYERLLQESGLTVRRVIPRATLPIIEASPSCPDPEVLS